MNCSAKNAALIVSVLFLTACAAGGSMDRTADSLLDARSETDPPRTAVEALAPFYAQFEYDKPIAPPGPPLPGENSVLTSISVGSCSTGAREIPIFRTIAANDYDLFLHIGDNVYGDVDSDDATAPELRAAYHQMAARPEFQELRARIPFLTTWDDHDYGQNDMGGRFAFKGFTEQLFLDFWRAPADDIRRTREGIYDARIFGPEGQRVQIILLDTRYFRTDLTPTDERGAVGRERYLPSSDPDQNMLGDEQWAWLENELRKPADLRLLVSSIQVIADGHGWEAWRTMPLERERLYRLINDTQAEAVVFVSGDRHSSGLYVREDVAPYPLYEITSSSLNLSSRDENNEPGPHRIGEMYAPVNYGVIDIDWTAGEVALKIKDLEGRTVREHALSLKEIGSG
jgi:alkaline phosphatase D